jgi:hypothetical protein
VSPVLTTPAPGSELSGSSVAFTWTAGAGPAAYQLELGTTGVGSSNLFNSGGTTVTTDTVSDLPTSGVKVYARLYWEIDAAWKSADYTYTATSNSYAVDMTWDAPVDSEDPVAGYNVYRSPSGSSTYQLLNSLVDTQTAYVDSTVQNGLSYDYIVESVDASGNESVPTVSIAVTIP